MSATAQELFAQLVARDSQSVDLDRGCLFVAAALRPEVDVDGALATLDELADGVAVPTFDGVRRRLFVDAGFRGNTSDYDDPQNSFLDAVLVRRIGLPITLSVVTIEVARRVGVAVEPIGAPAHFVVRDSASGLYCDPFGGGRLLGDAVEAAQTLSSERGIEIAPSMLGPISERAVLSRVIANLERVMRSRDAESLRVLLDLHAVIPGLPTPVIGEIADLFASLGLYGRAAEVVGDTDAVRARAYLANTN